MTMTMMMVQSVVSQRHCLRDRRLLLTEFPATILRLRFGSTWRSLRWPSLPLAVLSSRRRNCCSAGHVAVSPSYGNQTPVCGSDALTAITGEDDDVSRRVTSDMEEALMGFIVGRRKALEVVHSIWKRIIKKGDTVIDATCGNGYDTLTLLRLVADQSKKGVVYGMDIQKSAIESTSNLLDQFSVAEERESVKLFHLCHSKVEDVVPKYARVRLIAFNLGYLPGGDKSIITSSQTTLLALKAASRILESGGVISLVVYVGHPGGREEFETVQSFASCLPSNCWVSCKFEVLNKPTAPILVLLFKKLLMYST